MTIDKAHLRRPMRELLANSIYGNTKKEGTPAAQQSEENSVRSAVRPEIESSEQAERIGHSLIGQLGETPQRALEAVGVLDESKVADLLKEE